MNFLKKILGTKKDTAVTDNKGFWNWFIDQEKTFYGIIKKKENIDADFLEPLMQKLQQLNTQFYCLVGMYDENTAELVITAEGDIKTFVFVEELVAAAPFIKGWMFTALKSPSNITTMSISMGGYEFNSNTLHFFSNNDPEHPDEIDITLVHRQFNEKDKKIITNGSFIYLDNLLGELNTATLIDSVRIVAAADEQPEPISIEKLKDFLLWREKEFIEKYQGMRHDTENDAFASFEGKDKDGLFSISVVNQDLLDWDATASHPWLMLTEIKYDGANNNGMPDDSAYNLMEQFEESLSALLPGNAGYLNLGRETYNSARTIYFACTEFRNVSKTVHELIKQYADRLDISYDIFKDKYWMVMNKYRQIAG